MEGDALATVVILACLAALAVAYGVLFRHRTRVARRRYAGLEKGGETGTAPPGHNAPPQDAAGPPDERRRP